MDLTALMAALKDLYPNGSPYHTLDELVAAHKDLFEAFPYPLNVLPVNKTLEHYLMRQGFLSVEEKESAAAAAKQPILPPNEATANIDYSHLLPYELISILCEKLPEKTLDTILDIEEDLRSALQKASKHIGYGSLEIMLQANGFTVKKHLPPADPKSKTSRVKAITTERFEEVIEQLRMRYPAAASEGTLTNLKKANPDLKLGSLSGFIKSTTGLTLTQYFQQEEFIVPIKILDCGLDTITAYLLQDYGIYYIGELMKLSLEEIGTLPLHGTARLRARQFAEKYLALYQVEIELVGFPKRILNTLSNNNIQFAHQVLHRYRGCPGIGPASITKIQEVLTQYAQGHPYVSPKTEMPRNTEPEAVTQLPAEPPVPQRNEAQEKLQSFVNDLTELYPPESKRESLMVYLRRNNPHLPFEEADSWCRAVYQKSLKEYLIEIGLLMPKSIAADTTAKKDQDQQKSTPTTIQPEDGIDTEDCVFEAADIDACVQADTDGFKEYIAEKNLVYAMHEVGNYLRTLYRYDLSAYLKKTSSCSYAEHLIVHGFIAAKPPSYWSEALLQFLQENYTVCPDGILHYGRSCFAYNSIRHTCKIATPIYNGYEPISNLDIEKSYAGNLTVKPHYFESNYACDVVIMSNNVSLGNLNRTLFRSSGLGEYLFSAFYAGAAVLSSVALSQDEHPYAILEIKLILP